MTDQSPNNPPKYLIEFVDAAADEDAMFDRYDILFVEGKSAMSIAACWDETVANRILAGFEMLDMLDSGVVPGVQPRVMTTRKTRAKKTETK